MALIPSDPAGAAELYRGLPDTPHFALDDRRELVYAPLTRVARTVPAFCVRLLQCCRTFATLDEHARRIGVEFNLPPHELGPLREHLATLAANGLLIGHRDACARLRTADAAEPVRITTVGVPTRDRTDSLGRCLAALLTAPRDGPPPEFVVVDDSARAEDCAANRALLGSLRAHHGRPLWYAGPEARSAFAGRLAARTGIDPAVVSFALLNDENCPVATGTGRNLLLLHAAGEALLQIDDDVVARVAPAPAARPGLVLSSRQDPRQFWFPPDDVVPPEAFAASDLLAVHEQLLGKHSGEWLDSVADGQSPDFDGVDAGFFRRLGPAGGRVRLTAAGIAGDSGMTSPLYYLLFEGDARARLHRAEAVYRQAVTRQQVVCAVTRPTVTEGALCMGLNLGLDNRRLLPPFMPVQRNQDGVFGALVKACCPDTFFGYLPWLVRHQPPRPRAAGPEAVAESLAGVRSDRVLQLLIRLLAPAGGADDRNLRVLGEALAHLGAAPVAEFEEVVRLQVWADVSRVAARLAGLLQKFGGQPAWWAADVRRLLDVFHERLPQDSYAVPEDLRRAFGPDAAPALFRRLVHRFGRLLAAWPDLVAAAHDLRARGIRPAEPV